MGCLLTAEAGIWTSFREPQNSRGENVIGHGPAPGLDIGSDVLSMVVGCQLRLDVPLAYLPAEPGSFLLGPALAGWSFRVSHPSP